jgi:hypothetical protein
VIWECGGNDVQPNKKVSLKKYYEENKEWLQMVAQGSDIVVKSMALAILQMGSDPEQ